MVMLWYVSMKVATPMDNTVKVSVESGLSGGNQLIKYDYITE